MGVEYLQNEYIVAILFLVGSVILSKIIEIVLKQYVKRFTKSTKTDIDDIILSIVTRPVYAFIIVIGLYLGAKQISDFASYFQYINGVFFVLATLLAGMIVAKVVQVFVPRVLKVSKKFEKTPQLISKIVGFIIYVVAVLIILDHFGVEIGPLIAALGIGGLAIGLALQKPLSDLFAGILVISDDHISVGDYIQLPDGTKGTIEDISWRSTKIKKFPDMVVGVPNSIIADSMVTNVHLPQREISTVVSCGVSYEADLDKVEKIVIQEAKKIQKKEDGAVSDHEPVVRFKNFGDSNIDFIVVLRVNDFLSQYRVTHEFMKLLKKRFDKEKIDINYPVRKIIK